MNRSPNFIALREFRDDTRIEELQDIDENPNLFVFFRCLELFQEYNLPIEHVGKVRVDITRSFFESKKFAHEIILSFVKYCRKIYDLILEKVNDEQVAKQIFGDWLDNRMGIYWYDRCEENDENDEESFDESE